MAQLTSSLNTFRTLFIPAGGAIVCNGTTVTHAVQTIGCGYILQNNAYVPVYIIKNQWSEYWVGHCTLVLCYAHACSPAAICIMCDMT